MWTQTEKGRVEHPFEPVILGAALAMIPLLLVERDAKSDAWQTVALVGNWLIWAFFAAELTFVLIVAPQRRKALRAHWLDAAIVLVTLPLYGALVGSLRFLRLLRAVIIVWRVLQAERRLGSASSFRLVALATMVLVVVAGAVQATVDQGEFATYWEGVWWAAVTVTTVGYGDLYPTTVAGRIVAICLMLAGIGFLAVLTATIASRFVAQDQADENEEIIAALQRLEADVAELKAKLLSG
jgi:voltage-gated potassium channel